MIRPQEKPFGDKDRRGVMELEPNNETQGMGNTVDTIAPSCRTSTGEFTIRLRPLPGWPAPPIRRLSRFLKMAKRGFGFQCTSAREVQS